MKRLVVILFCISAFYVNAQKIENLKIDQKGGELQLTYNINGAFDNIFKVSVFYSSDNNHWELADKVYGDVGDSIMPGMDKKIILWLDHINNVKQKMSFKILAEYYTIDQKQEGNFKDNHGNNYNWKRFGKTRWMLNNLKNSISDNDCGGQFNHSSAKNACPDGWILPTDEDWMNLEVEFGIDKEKVKEHGLREINISELNNAGFSIKECSYSTSFYPNQKAVAFWTSSENKMLYTGYSDKYFARIFRIDEGKVSKELRNKNEKLSIRCTQPAKYLAKIDNIITTELNLNPISGKTNHPFTGEELEWQYAGGEIWLKNDVTGSYMYKETTNRCPAGWRLPDENEWKALFDEFKPSLNLNNRNELLGDRLSTKGIWSFNLSSSDYWMSTNFYTYNTYWINNDDKEISKKLMVFPSNEKGIAGWVEKQTNEKAKVRCVLDNEDYINKKDAIKTGIFTDKRDNTDYGFVEIDGRTWLSENLNFDLGENSTCRNNIKADCKLFGHMYNIEVIENGCPDGWRLPTSEEWKYLLINKAANNLKILYPFGGTGFDLLFGGEVIFNEDEKTEIYSAKYLFLNEDKPGYFYIDSNGKVELNEKAKKKDFYYVRCIKK